MTDERVGRYRVLAVAVLRNPHFWVVVTLSAILLLLYQSWPWREWVFADGLWRYFSWLSVLDVVVVNVSLKYHLIGVFFLVPIIYGSLTLSWPGGVLAWLLSLIWVLPTLIHWSKGTLIINLAQLLLPALLVAVVTLERRWRARERRIFKERARERQVYVAKLVEVQEAEQHRIARELHDETLQTLMAIANKSNTLAATGRELAQVQGNIWIGQELLRTMEDLRRLSLNLRPSILDNFGLVSALRWLVNSCNPQDGLRFAISIRGEERRLPRSMEVTVFRLAQEAMNNVQQHAGAGRAELRVEFGDRELSLVVEDDGVGFRPPERLVLLAAENKLGVVGMEERALSAGGRMEIDSGPGKGTTVTVTIPYESPTASIDLVVSETLDVARAECWPSAEVVEG